MNQRREFKKQLSTVFQLWKKQAYDEAFAVVASMLESWPGNAQLHLLWASLVQLQENPQQDLEEVKQALQQAVELDRDSPAATIELGHFLDNVEDDPQAASKAYAEGVAAARRLLIDGLLGQAKALRQMNKREEFLRCLLEVLHLSRYETGGKGAKAQDAGADLILESPPGHFQVIQLKGPYAEQIQDLLSDLVAKRSA
jgi:tetratricopeptide (TPR) repeat protein